MKTIIGLFIVSSLIFGCTTTSTYQSESIKQEVVAVTYLVNSEVKSTGPINDSKCFISWGDDWSVISLESETTIEKTYVKTEDIINYGTIETK